MYILANAIDSLQSLRNASDSPVWGAILSLVLLIIGALLKERKLGWLWVGFSFAVFFLVGALGYSPGKSEAALPFAVFFVMLWYFALKLINRHFVHEKK